MFQNIFIVQARFGSNRLRGKVLKSIAPKLSMLSWVVENLKSWSHIDSIVVATSSCQLDDVVAQEAKDLGVHVFRGSEKDVASRLVAAGSLSEFSPSNVRCFRVCADNPFLCEDLYHELLEHLGNGNSDAKYLSHSFDSIPAMFTDFGIFVEYFNHIELKSRLSSLTEIEREHATLTFINDPNTEFLPFIHEWDSNFRLTCDTMLDLEHARLIAKDLNFPIRLTDLISVVKMLPESVVNDMRGERESNKKV